MLQKEQIDKVWLYCFENKDNEICDLTMQIIRELQNKEIDLNLELKKHSGFKK